MKNKRFISVDESGESIFTFDEADMIIDTKTNIVYGANNVPDLVKILNHQSSQWQKLKEWLEKDIEKNHKENEQTDLSVFLHYIAVEQCILQKMQGLEGEDEQI